VIETNDSTWIVPMVLFCMGAIICVVAGHGELAGLGLMILAAALQVIWGIEERR
jgi:hypothetical protein